jgi:hypothetical protein
MDVITLAAIAFLAMTIFVVFLLIKVPNNYGLKFLAVPLLIGLGCQFVNTLPEVLGRPKHGMPEQEFVLQSFRTAFVGDKLFLEIWVTENGQSRLYQFPYDEKIADVLRKLVESHGDAHGKFGKTPGNGKGQDTMPGLNMLDIPNVPLPPKNQ